MPKRWWANNYIIPNIKPTLHTIASKYTSKEEIDYVHNGFLNPKTIMLATTLPKATINVNGYGHAEHNITLQHTTNY